MSSTPLQIPTQPIGSIPRPREWIAAAITAEGDETGVAQLYDEATKDNPSTTRDTRDVKIRARVLGAQPASRAIHSE